MNVERYDLDSLRKIVRSLEKENNKLKEKLKNANIPFEENEIFDEHIENNEKYDLDQGGRIISFDNITDDMAKLFFMMFWGRTDVYAKRGKNGGYFPQCKNRWNEKLCLKYENKKAICDTCANKQWAPLELWQIKAHLKGAKEDGSDVIGIYPLLKNGMCRFIVFDFDNHEKGSEANDFGNKDDDWHDEVDALRKICVLNGIKPLVERSRSGKGAHVWIFFNEPIPATLARNFGFLLLDKGAISINMKSFHYYDRMYPSQDVTNSIGNLIALPLQGKALKEGNSAFVDDDWNAYQNQWDVLLRKTKKLTLNDIETFIVQWKEDLAENGNLFINPINESRPKPWKKELYFHKEDVIGKFHIVLSDGIYVDTLNIMPRLQNQIRSLAAFDNPEYYKNARMGYSNYYNFSAIYLGKDIDGYIQIPRGLKEMVIDKCSKAGIEVNISDQTGKGRPIRVTFKGDLRTEQDLAAEKLLSYSDGVLQAATAFGKTVVCSYLISKKKVSTLILLQNKELIQQWIDELNKFLEIDEELPEYETKTGRKKKRNSLIGVLHGGKNSLTGIVDLAMVQSLSSKENIDEILSSYGMVIMDECHHAASNTSVDLLKKVKAKYVYGVSATTKRGDKLEKIIFMLIGPIRYKYTALDRAKEQGIEHYIIPRYTRIVDNYETKSNINKAFNYIVSNAVRNEMIIDDVKNCVNDGYTPVILTKTKEQARLLKENLSTSADNVLIYYGDNSNKENLEIQKTIKNVKKEESLIIIATGQKIGEGFNCPRLDVLMLASPISDEGRLEQYVGRLNRDYEGKKAVFVYDYVDSHMYYFNRMYSKRLRTYKKIGFSVYTKEIKTKQVIKAIYDSGDYSEKFEQDLIEAEKEIVISSPEIQADKIERFIKIIKGRQKQGVSITIITINPEMIKFRNPIMCYKLIHDLKTIGINVVLKDEINEHFAVIDNLIVWHGGMNLLGKEDVWDNLMRIQNPEVASELLELELS